MKAVRSLLDVVTAFATVAAFLVASIALVDANKHRTGGAAPAVSAFDSPGFLDGWPFLLLLVVALSLAGGILAIGSRQPDVGLGGPAAVRSPGLGAGDREGRWVISGGRSAPERGKESMSERRSVWDLISVVAAVTALVIATLAYGKAAGGHPGQSAAAAVTSREEAGTTAQGADTGTTTSTVLSGGASPRILAELGEFTIELSPAEIPAGPVLVDVANTGVTKHNLVLENGDARTGDLGAGESTQLDLGRLAAGEYVLICDIPGHRQAVMETTLTVKGG